MFDASGAIIATAAAWSGSPDASALREAGSRVGAFPFKEGSADSALLRTLGPGNYTVQVSGRLASAGVVLIEAYDLDAVTGGSRLVNLSTRGTVGTGENIMIAGFSVGGDTPIKLLIRAVGPSLARFGVTDPIALPTMGLSNSTSGPIYPGGSWSTSNHAELRAAAVRAGAFPLDEGSRDSAWIRTVPPGNWFVQVFGYESSQGAGLVEVYEVP
ncbi:hypothetical protein [Horticoccus sp. 23ND18S-11]|uniref:hypothetical protein n=1 Tax=Horticoccus sp. 23ND18S-11 TaxID=3391832 RepID=UPI0039C970D0